MCLTRRMIAHPLILHGTVIRLEPLESDHVGPLMEIALNHVEAFRFTSTPAAPEQQDAYFSQAFKGRAAGDAYPFAIVHQATERVVGTTRYADILWPHRNCELGYTWLDPAMQGTAVNVESKYLMLRYLFEAQDWLRVQIHTDTRNLQSQHAIRALGAEYEGVLRAHKVVKEGYVRDTMVFSVIHSDWPRVKRLLEERFQKKQAKMQGLAG
jgi:RimJ/RimL family protein N-acetyltransferase